MLPPSQEAAAAVSEDFIRRLVLSPDDSIGTLVASDDEWVISRDMAAALAGLVRHLRPTSILEFGAGRSSLVLASALESIGGGRLTSIEHQPAYAQAAWKEIANYTHVDAVLVQATLARRVSKLGFLHDYTGVDQAISSRGPFGLVFIDAPPGHLGRDSTLFRAAPYMAQGALAVLDDAARPQEQTAVQRWLRGLDAELVMNAWDLARGIAVLRLAHPRLPSFSARTFFGTIHDRVLEYRTFRRRGRP